MDDIEKTFAPFLKEESAIYLLGLLMDNEQFSIRSRYQLEIITNLFRNGKTDVFKRVPPETLGGLAKGGRRNVAASIVARAENIADSDHQREGGSTGETDRHLLLGWDVKEQALETWARSEKIWMENADATCRKRFGSMIGNGAEAKVYDNGQTVVKTIGTIYDPQEQLDRIAVTNTLFPETGMELLGLGRNDEGEFCIVIRQPFVEGSFLEAEEVHMDILDDFRMITTPEGRKEFATDNLLLGDLHDRNVLRTPEGRLAVIDCNTWLNTPERGRGGKWDIPAVAYEEGAIGQMLSFLKKTVPQEMSREGFIRLFATEENEIENQLKETGRVNGTVSMKTKGGDMVDMLVQVSADNPALVLVAPLPGVKQLLSLSPEFQRLDATEQSGVLMGLAVPNGNGFLGFDLNRGRLEKVKRYEPKLGYKETLQQQVRKKR